MNTIHATTWDRRRTAVVYYFDFIRHLVRRDFMLRYRGSVLGLVWSIVPPLVQLAVLVFLFRKVIQLGIESYPAFVFTALLPWNWFTNSVTSGAGLFVSSRDLVRRPQFPTFTLAVVHTLSNFLSYLVALPILFVLLVLYGRDFTSALVVLPVLICMQGLLISGLTLIVATLNVFYRDVQHITGLVMMLMFYVTPVFYRMEAISTEYQFLFRWNPIAVLVDAYRTVLFYGRFPSFHSFLFITVVTGFVVALGYYIYLKTLHEMVDRI